MANTLPVTAAFGRFAACLSPWQRRITTELELRQDTPPDALARDSLPVADVLARGSSP